MPTVPKPDTNGSRSTADPLARAWMAKVAAVRCVVCTECGLTPLGTIVHHVREGQGLSQRAQDWLTVALCREHHVGASGWHTLGKMGFYQRYKLDEMDLLALTLEAIARTEEGG